MDRELRRKLHGMDKASRAALLARAESVLDDLAPGPRKRVEAALESWRRSGLVLQVHVVQLSRALGDVPSPEQVTVSFTIPAELADRVEQRSDFVPAKSRKKAPPGGSGMSAFARRAFIEWMSEHPEPLAQEATDV